MNNEKRTLSLVKLFNETAPIKDQLPIDIDGFDIAELLMRCSGCKKSIKQDLIHGYATKPLPNTASFHAVCVCHECKTVTESVQRIKKISDHVIRFEKLSNEGKWENSEVDIRDDHWIISFIKRIFGFKNA